MTIGIALLGAGIFAQNEHLPAIEACDLLQLKAVYSRSQPTAEALVTKAGKPGLDTYFDVPAVPGRGLADLLARADVAAVAVCMPINLQPHAIRAALAAGKHVISEKPVAETVATARVLVSAYGSGSPSMSRPIWAVAENYRFQKSLELAVAKLRAIGGSLVSFNLLVNKFVRPDGNYFNTPWRKNPTHPGGFLLDGGIHHVAGLRALLAAAGPSGNGPDSNTIAKVVGTTEQLLEILPPADTMRSIAITRGGRSGIVSVSFGTEFGATLEITVTTTEGLVTWKPTSVRVVSRSGDTTIDCSPANPEFPAGEENGVKAEFAAFAQSIAAGKNVVDARQSPQEALEDLLLLEAMFDTGAAGCQLKEIPTL